MTSKHGLNPFGKTEFTAYSYHPEDDIRRQTILEIIDWIEKDADASINRQNWRGMAIAEGLRKMLNES